MLLLPVSAPVSTSTAVLRSVPKARAAAESPRGHGHQVAGASPLWPGARVLLFTDSLEPSGVGQHMWHLARELRALGYAPSVACPDTPAAQSLIERCTRVGVTVHRLCVRQEEDTEDYRRLVRLLRFGGFDLFHNHCGITWEGCWGTLAAADAEVPVICTEHLPYVEPVGAARDLKLRATRLVAATIAVSQGVARSFLCAGAAALERLRVVWNGVDLTAFAGPHRPARRRTLLGLPPASPLAVSVGRMTAQKGHALLLEAVALARRSVPDLTLVLAGDGPLRDELEARAGALGLLAAGSSPGRAVRFLGHYGDVPGLLSCADLLAQPSAFEGHPLAVLEAMAAGLPAVVTDTIGSNETVEHERSGLVIPPDDPAALAAALARLALDRRLARRMGVAARRHSARQFSAQTMVQRTLRVYERALISTRPASGSRAAKALDAAQEATPRRA
jgi:glycosyltransferase involved in cell wall biosynthesis